ncbi:hypothetical protein FQN57_003276 [Myotisia sp. PD_48]|nr:hypothetical protein FQN57_003276 [Myotisia sp. PD_48]
MENSKGTADSHITSTKHIPISQIQVLSQEIDDEHGYYRIRAGNRVHFVKIDVNAYDEETMRVPYYLIRKLPNFPDSDWIKMRITRSVNGSLSSSISFEPLPGIWAVWHPRQIDILSLKRTVYYGPSISEVMFEGRPAVLKIARWEWEIPHRHTETAVYRDLTQRQDKNDPVIPEFLGHVTENGRVMGILLEKIEGDFAYLKDLEACTRVLSKIHAMGVIHGDPNRYNFIINRSTASIRMIDFEHSWNFTEADSREELESLPKELVEDTGRGLRTRRFNIPEFDPDRKPCAVIMRE